MFDVDDGLTTPPSNVAEPPEIPELASETAALICVAPDAATDSPFPPAANGPDNVTLGVSANAKAGKSTTQASTATKPALTVPVEKRERIITPPSKQRYQRPAGR
jgi:hypothetical protein